MAWQIVGNNNLTRGKVILILQEPGNNFNKIEFDPFDSEGPIVRVFLNADDHKPYTYRRWRNKASETLAYLLRTEPSLASIQDQLSAFLNTPLKSLDEVFNSLIEEKEIPQALELANSFHPKPEDVESSLMGYRDLPAISFKKHLILGDCLLKKGLEDEALKIFKLIPNQAPAGYNKSSAGILWVFLEARKRINSILLKQNLFELLFDQTQSVSLDLKSQIDSWYMQEDRVLGYIAELWNNLAEACLKHNLPTKRLLALEKVPNQSSGYLSAQADLANAYFDLASKCLDAKDSKQNLPLSLDEDEVRDDSQKERFEYLEKAFRAARRAKEDRLSEMIFHALQGKDLGQAAVEPLVRSLNSDSEIEAGLMIARTIRESNNKIKQLTAENTRLKNQLGIPAASSEEKSEVDSSVKTNQRGQLAPANVVAALVQRSEQRDQGVQLFDSPTTPSSSYRAK